MTPEKKILPYGQWPSPLTPGWLGSLVRLSDVRWTWDGSGIVWREEKAGRGSLYLQRLDEQACRELTPEQNVRAGVNYGGGDFGLGPSFVCYVAGGQLYRRPLEPGAALALTPPWGQCASPAVSPDGRTVVYVHEAEGKASLAAVGSDTYSWPVKLAEGRDFYMQPAWSSTGQLAWVAWDQPNMPWDGTALYVAELDSASPLPRLVNVRAVAGEPSGQVYCFQPCFSPDGRYLAYISDRSGWSNLHVFDLDQGVEAAGTEEAAEHALPAWIQGQRTISWSGDGRSIRLIRCHDSAAEIHEFEVQTGRLKRAAQRPYRYYQQIDASPRGDQWAALASAPHLPPRVVVGGSTGILIFRRSSSESIPEAHYSHPQSLSWPTPQGRTVRGLFYPPHHPEVCGTGRPPAIIKVHGGPTAESVQDFEGDTQYWTTRGFAVLEVNYRGSWGYGRAYRLALSGEWGAADVEDVCGAASHLIDRELVDPQRVVVAGGSAGGFTALLALIRRPELFRAAVCRYAVTNLLSLASLTHKFEAAYLDGLVGLLPDEVQKYRDRSPLYQADKISAPLAIFQGDEDAVVPLQQAEQLVEVLRRRKVPCLYTVYEGEGHGFRKPENIQDYYQKTEAFLREHVLFLS